MVEFPKISVKKKHFKTFYETETASRLEEIIQQIFSYENIQEYTDIFFPSASRMQFWVVQKRCSANAFCETNQKHVSWKI